MEFKRRIKLFFVYYGRLLLYIIGIIALIFFILRSLNSYAIKQKKKTESTPEEKIIAEEKKEQEKTEKKIVTSFIESCNNGEINYAYSLLSDMYKQGKCKTVLEFKNNYINDTFSIKIYEYKIENENGVYVVTLKQDMLTTGKTDSKKITKLKVDNITEKIEIVD